VRFDVRQLTVPAIATEPMQQTPATMMTSRRLILDTPLPPLAERSRSDRTRCASQARVRDGGQPQAVDVVVAAGVLDQRLARLRFTL